MKICKKKLLAKISSVKNTEPTRRDRMFSKDEIEKLSALGRERYSQMSIEESFEYECRNAFITIQYELALRSAETVTMAWEDFENAEDKGDGVKVLNIRHGKMLKEHEFAKIPVVYSRLKPTLDLWRKISNDYCKKYAIKPPECEENSVKYHPIFFDKKGKQLISRFCTNIVKKQCKLAGIKLNTGETFRTLRHAKITNLLVKGKPIKALTGFTRWGIV